MTIKLYVSFTAEHWNSTCQATIPEHWEGYTDAITFKGGSALDGEPIRIDGFTREDVIAQVVAELKSRGLTGNLKVINS